MPPSEPHSSRRGRDPVADPVADPVDRGTGAGAPLDTVLKSCAEPLSAAYDVAVLPWGATEAHNWHLPYATDVIQCDHVAAEAARLAWERGAKPIVLPAVPFGVQTGQLDIPLCLNLNPSTQAAILADLVHALEGQGIRKLLILNAHGGNDFRAIIRELQPKTELFLCTINWWNCVDPRPFFDTPGGVLAVLVGGSVDRWDDTLAIAEPVLESVQIGDEAP